MWCGLVWCGVVWCGVRGRPFGVRERVGDARGEKTTRAGVDEKKEGGHGHPRGSALICPGPPLGRSVCFTFINAMFVLIYRECSKVLLGGSGGCLGGGKASPRGSWGTFRVARGRPWMPLGYLGAALGGRGAPSERTSGKRAAWHNQSFHFITWYILAITVVAVAP